MSRFKYRVEVGGLMRGSFRSSLKRFKHEYGWIRFDIDEDKRFMDSTFYLDIEGPDEDVDRISYWLRSLQAY